MLLKFTSLLVHSRKIPLVPRWRIKQSRLRPDQGRHVGSCRYGPGVTDGRPELTQAPWGEGKDGVGLEREMSEQSTSGNELLLARGGARERGSADLPAGR